MKSLNILAISAFSLATIQCKYARKVMSGTEVTAQEALAMKKEKLANWAPKCGDYASKVDCGDGDMTLFNSLLCYSGEEIGCQGVQNSQSEDGRMWRSPRLKNNDPENTFSRDMGIGTLLYLATTKDVKLGQKWSEYVSQTGRLCPEKIDKCRLSRLFMITFDRVATFAGFATLNFSNNNLAPNEPEDIIEDLRDAEGNLIGKPSIDLFNDSASFIDDVTLLGESKVTELGYQLHLVSVHLAVRQQMTAWNVTLQGAGDTLTKRQPGNLFFKILATGKSDDLAATVIERFPDKAPENPFQWSHERADADEAWRSTMAWDGIFVINLLTR